MTTPAGEDAPGVVESTTGSTNGSLRTNIRRGVSALVERPLTIAFLATIGVLGALILGSAVGSITSIIIWIVLALFISLGLDPIVRLLERRGLKRGMGIGIVFAGFALAVVAFILFVLPPVVAQVIQFVEVVPDALRNATSTDWFLSLSSDTQATLEGILQSTAATLHQPGTLAAIGGGVLGIGVSVVSAVSAGLIVVALTLYFLASLDSMKAALYRLAPARSRIRLSDMTDRVTASVGASLIGSVVLSTINASIVLVLHLLIGLPFPALMALIAFIVTLIPLFGSVIFLILATGVALFSSPTQAITFAIAYLVYIQLESYVVTPRVMNRAISIPAALVLIGALIGATLMGIVGVLIALPIMATLLLIIREVVVPKQDLKD